jgi:ribulose-5-phosphate 4-epimerase/fuculose-1-phosphate aldolase
MLVNPNYPATSAEVRDVQAAARKMSRRQLRQYSIGPISAFMMSTCLGFNMVFFSAPADGRHE